METDTPRREGARTWPRVAAWSLYDFANSPYSTLMTTVGFPLFFLEVVAPGSAGPLWWGFLYGASEVVAALMSPALGAWSDQVGRRKPFLVGFTLLCAAGTALCAFVGAGDLPLAFLAFGLANVGFACALVFYNALLVEVAAPGQLDTVSGIGWATGYMGGIAGLLMAMPLYAAGTGIANLRGVHLSFVLVAVILLVFSVPVFLMRERGVARDGAAGPAAAYREVWRTLKRMREHRDAFFLLVGNFFLNDGLNTVILFAAAYAKTVAGLSGAQILVLFVYLNAVAALGALALGWVADRAGGRRTLLVLVASWTFLTVGLAWVQTPVQFIVGAGVAGFLLGPSQAVARSLMARLSPEGMEGEFFGFFGMSGKMAALVGPVLFGAAAHAAGSLRAGALAMVPLFALGLFFIAKVGEAAPKGGGAPGGA